ncbi:MAG: ATP-dependent RecD-like DNA helicase [Pseudomonadota bacterium]
MNTPSASPREHVSGIVERILFRNETTGYAGLQIRAGGKGRLDTVVGTAPVVDIGDLVDAEGRWEHDPSWGRQFRATFLVHRAPAGAAGLAAYLGSGIVKGIGRGLAGRLVGHFGEGLIDVLDRTPARLAEVKGVGPKLADEIAAAWREQKGVREVMLFLYENGLPPGRAKRIWETYKDRTIAVLRQDPYALARDVQGIGFLLADDVARRMGIDRAAPERHRAGLLHVLNEAAGQGHTGVARAEARALLEQVTGADEAAFDAAVEGLLGLRALVIADDMLHPEPLATQESRIARAVTARAKAEGVVDPAAAERRIADAEATLALQLSPSQREAAALLLDAKIAVLTGGPGTGKTTLVRTLLAAVDLDADDVALAAPTGRAAKRLTESTGRDAKTLHRLLEAEPGRAFRRGPARPLAAKLMIVDEASMVDVTLMDALLQALGEDATLWLVGDVDQLPSVGPGRVLGDLIESDVVPVVRLREIFRQAAESLIVANAHRLIRGEVPMTAPSGALADFYVIAVRDADDAVRKLQALVAERMPLRFELDPMDDVQVLCPTNRGTLGARALNDALRARLNPAPADSVVRGERSFAVGDRVMQTENDYDRDVYNGDLGRLVAIDRQQRTLSVDFDDRSLGYGFDELDALQPAYAVTVHKAQGSEYPAVVVVLARQHGRLLRRDLVYTALTRARRLAVLLVEGDALARAVAARSAGRRVTRLRNLLGEMAES